MNGYSGWIIHMKHQALFPHGLIKKIRHLSDLQIRVRIGIFLFYFSSKTYVEGEKNRLNETVQWDCSFENPKHMLKLMGKKIIKILRK